MPCARASPARPKSRGRPLSGTLCRGQQCRHPRCRSLACRKRPETAASAQPPISHPPSRTRCSPPRIGCRSQCRRHCRAHRSCPLRGSLSWTEPRYGLPLHQHYQPRPSPPQGPRRAKPRSHRSGSSQSGSAAAPAPQSPVPAASCSCPYCHRATSACRQPAPLRPAPHRLLRRNRRRPEPAQVRPRRRPDQTRCSASPLLPPVQPFCFPALPVPI
mmetsp:Transcript_14414/g.33355  ORF Transcript_14414/g.33355 Transcript_14414/m.33355 type:complete len:216 (-) Transcript_14414:679-1326(-)